MDNASVTIYITRNSEYHIDAEGYCVKVFNRHSLRNEIGHLAIGRHAKTIQWSEKSVLPTEAVPQTGDALYFFVSRPGGGDKDFVTTQIIKIEKSPIRQIVRVTKHAA